MKAKARYADGGNVAGNTASGSPGAAFMQPQYPTPPTTFSTPSPDSGSGGNDSSKGAGITINLATPDGGTKQANFRKGGAVKKSSSVKKRTTSSASKRADGAAQRGKTRGRYI